MEGYDDEGVGVLAEIQNDQTDDRRSSPLEELLSALDWAGCTGDDESLQSLMELIMLDTLLTFLKLPEVTQLTDNHYRTLVAMATEAVKHEGYIEHHDEFVLGLLGKYVAGRDERGWHFDMIRSRAWRLISKRKYAARIRSGEPKKSTVDASAVDCTQSTSLTKSSISTQERPAGACARNSNVLCGQERASTVDASARVRSESDGSNLFPDFNEPLAEPAKEPVKRTVRPEPWHPLFDAIVKVTKADSRDSTRSHVAKVAKDLHGCEPAYAADDVLALPAILEHQPWWKASGGVLSIQVVQRHIGLVRSAKKAAVKVEPDEYKSLDQLQREAVQSRSKRKETPHGKNNSRRI